LKYLKYLYTILFLVSLSCAKQEKTKEESLTSFVNPFIGTDGPGNTYPGATLPFGMVQLSPDIGIPGWDRIAGYFYQDSIISGFSHTHLTGTGAGDMYDILVMPTNSRFSERIKENNFKPFSKYSHDKEEASPGYYSVDLLDYGIKAEVTSTYRTGVHKYTFPEDSLSVIHVDLGYSLNWDAPKDTYIEKINDSTLRGYRMSTGWARDQRLYFEMQFSKPFLSYNAFSNDSLVKLPLRGKNTRVELHYNTSQGEQIIIKTGFNRYDTFSLWDTFRAAHPLYTITQPERVPDMINSMLAHYNETGILPVWSMQGNETNMMIGYHAVPVIVDAYFNIYKEKGFIPVDEHHENWSVSKTLEYAYDDWCIAMFAKELGKEQDYNHFIKRSENWKNLYNDKRSWLQPKNTKGEFIEPFIPKEYTPYFCESNAWQYYWFVPQDINGLITKTGGKERFLQKLDSMFSYAALPEDKLPIFSTGMIGQYAHGNEPSHHVAYLYNYINKPSKTQELTNTILNNQYKNEPNGHCGNEDCGQMSSWYIFNALGLYPVNPAQGVYHISSPLFHEAEIQLADTKTFKIITKNNSEDNIYIKSIKLNNSILDRLYITHKELLKGGVLEFEMTSIPNDSLSLNMKFPDKNTVY